MTFQAPKPDAGSDANSALRQHTREIASSVRALVAGANMVAPVMPEEFLAKGDGVTDDSEAFAAALAASAKIVCTPGKTYCIKDVAVPVGGQVDLNGAIIKPAAGARSCFTRIGGGFGGSIRNGTFTDPDRVTLRSTTATVAALAGDTVLTVGATTDFEVGEPVWVVTDQPDFAAKLILHHTKIVSLTSTTIELKDALPHAVSVGRQVMVSRGMIRVDGPNDFHITDITFSNVPIGITWQGQTLAAQASGRGEIANIQFLTFLLGGIYIGHDVRAMSYKDIKGFGNSPDVWRSGFGWKIDARDFITVGGDIGSHIFEDVNWLSVQDCFWASLGLYLFFNNCVADNARRYGYRIDHGSVALMPMTWATFSAVPISIAGGSQASATLLRTRDNGLWNLGYAVEVEDGALFYVNKSSWYGDQTIRNDTGWSNQNVRYSIGQNLQEPGAPSLPSLAFRDDADTGWYGIGGDEWRFAAGGVNTVNLNASGLRTLSGSAALPAYGFVGDDDTGMYRAGANQIAMAAGGAQIFVATPTGLAFTVPFAPPPITFAALPATSTAGFTYRVTDRDQRFATWDGTNWRFQDGTIAV